MSDYPWTGAVNANPHTDKNPYRHVGIQGLLSKFEDGNYSLRPIERNSVHTSSTMEGLAEALQDHASETVWLEPGVYQASLLPNKFDIPAGTTLASDGAVIAQDISGETPFSITNDGVRVTGIRFQGPMVEDPAVYEDAQALELDGAVEVDNCEIFGWPTAGVRVKGGEPRIRHNVIRDNIDWDTGGEDGDAGYAVYVEGGNPLIEYNFINGNLRGVAGDGSVDSSYRFQNNLHGEDGGNYQTAQEGPGGFRMEIQNNEFRMQETDTGGPGRAYIQYGTPGDVATIHHNWMWNLTPPGSQPDPDGEASIVQLEHDSTEWVNVTFSSNHHQHKKSVDRSVGIQRLSYIPRYQKRTDGRGISKFSLPDGSYQVSVRHEDYDEPVEGTLTVDGEDTELTLQFD